MKNEEIVIGKVVWRVFDWIGESHLMMGVVHHINKSPGMETTCAVTWLFGAPPSALEQATTSTHSAKFLYTDPDTAAKEYLSLKKEEIADHVWRAKRCLDNWDFLRWNQWEPGYLRDDRKADENN